jgi:brefeldin A-resistance guanine nucleotide exchange factor 1
VFEGGDVAETNKHCTEERPDHLSIQVTSPEGTTRPHKTPAHATSENGELDGSGTSIDLAASPDVEDKQFTNGAGVTFTSSSDMVDCNGSLIPYGLPAVYELLRFLASLINPYDQQNSEQQVQIGLNLITCALEVGVDSISRYPSLMSLVKDELCRNLISLLATERVGMFSAALRCCFLILSELRGSLKLQLEQYLNKLVNLIGSDSNRVSYQHKELALEQIVLLYKLPGFVTEVYLNYDCGLYTSNLFEDLTKVLSKNAYPVAGQQTV